MPIDIREEEGVRRRRWVGGVEGSGLSGLMMVAKDDGGMGFFLALLSCTDMPTPPITVSPSHRRAAT